MKKKIYHPTLLLVQRDVLGGWLTSRLLHRNACRRASQGGCPAQSACQMCFPENAIFKRFIATVAFRALTISPAMRGGRGGRGNHSEER